MSIVSRTYAVTPGATQVIHFTLTNARILAVKRSGITHYPGVLTPGNLEFVKVGPVLNFQIPFSGDLTDDPTRKETVFVLFET